jgi:hypothetical protein
MCPDPCGFLVGDVGVATAQMGETGKNFLPAQIIAG